MTAIGHIQAKLQLHKRRHSKTKFKASYGLLGSNGLAPAQPDSQLHSGQGPPGLVPERYLQPVKPGQLFHLLPRHWGPHRGIGISIGIGTDTYSKQVIFCFAKVTIDVLII